MSGFPKLLSESVYSNLVPVFLVFKYTKWHKRPLVMMIRQMTSQSFFFRLLQLFFSHLLAMVFAVVLDQRKVFDTFDRFYVFNEGKSLFFTKTSIAISTLSFSHSFRLDKVLDATKFLNNFVTCVLTIKVNHSDIHLTSLLQATKDNKHQ